MSGASDSSQAQSPPTHSSRDHPLSLPASLSLSPFRLDSVSAKEKGEWRGEPLSVNPSLTAGSVCVRARTRVRACVHVCAFLRLRVCVRVRHACVCLEILNPRPEYKEALGSNVAFYILHPDSNPGHHNQSWAS